MQLSKCLHKCLQTHILHITTMERNLSIKLNLPYIRMLQLWNMYTLKTRLGLIHQMAWNDRYKNIAFGGCKTQREKEYWQMNVAVFCNLHTKYSLLSISSYISYNHKHKLLTRFWHNLHWNESVFIRISNNDSATATAV